jgi:hypothetical protein
MPCSITIYKASCPAVDPNVLHQYHDLRAEGYSVFPRSRVFMDMECVYEYGTLVNATRRLFNYPKIQDDYCLSAKPRAIKRTDDGFVFSDGDAIVEIDNNTVINEYLLEERLEAYVVSLEKLFSTESSVVYDKLAECLLFERNMHPNNTAYYELSLSQALIANKYMPSNSLLRFFEYGKSPLYIQFRKYT